MRCCKHTDLKQLPACGRPSWWRKLRTADGARTRTAKIYFGLKPGSTPEVLALKAPLFTLSVKSDSCYNVPRLYRVLYEADALEQRIPCTRTSATTSNFYLHIHNRFGRSLEPCRLYVTLFCEIQAKVSKCKYFDKHQSLISIINFTMISIFHMALLSQYWRYKGYIFFHRMLFTLWRKILFRKQ